jgi:hypothetical protein
MRRTRCGFIPAICHLGNCESYGDTDELPVLRHELFEANRPISRGKSARGGQSPVKAWSESTYV